MPDALRAGRLNYGTWGWDMRSNICFSDPFASFCFGMQPAEGREGRPIERYFEAIHHDDRDRVKAKISLSIKTGAPYHEQYRVTALNGSVRTIIACGMAFKDAAGLPEIYPGTVMDTSREPAEDLIFDIGGHIALARQRAEKEGMAMLKYLLDMAHLEFWDTVRTGHPKAKATPR